MHSQESRASWDSEGAGSWRRPPPACFIPAHRPVPWGGGRLPEAGLCAHGGCLATGPQGRGLDQRGRGWTRGDRAGPEGTGLDQRGRGWTRGDGAGPQGMGLDQRGRGWTRGDGAGPQGTGLDQRGQGWTTEDKAGPQRTRRHRARGQMDTQLAHLQSSCPCSFSRSISMHRERPGLANRRNLLRNRQPPPRSVRRLSSPEHGSSYTCRNSLSG